MCGHPVFQPFGTMSAELQAAFPLLAHARGPLEIELHAGDVFYLPCGWWHCVEGSDGRNMILNYWMPIHPRKRAGDVDAPPPWVPAAT